MVGYFVYPRMAITFSQQPSPVHIIVPYLWVHLELRFSTADLR